LPLKVSDFQPKILKFLKIKITQKPFESNAVAYVKAFFITDYSIPYRAFYYGLPKTQKILKI
jgi:hypothetical protein